MQRLVSESDCEDVYSKLNECFKHTVMVLMMDELEILSWVNYIEKVNLLNSCYNVDDPKAILSQAENTIFYIAFSTKNLMNDKNVKDQISAHL